MGHEERQNVCTLPPLQLRALIPAPLKLEAPVVHFEFMSMPDSTGFGSYYEAGQVVPVTHKGVSGNFGECLRA